MQLRKPSRQGPHTCNWSPFLPAAPGCLPYSRYSSKRNNQAKKSYPRISDDRTPAFKLCFCAWTHHLSASCMMHSKVIGSENRNVYVMEVYACGVVLVHVCVHLGTMKSRQRHHWEKVLNEGKELAIEIPRQKPLQMLWGWKWWTVCCRELMQTASRR